MTRTDAPTFTVSRSFDAPRDLVYRVWTEQQHRGRWMSPAGLTPLESTLDLRPGGVFHYGMGLPDGQKMWGKWVFREVVPPERQTFREAFGGMNQGWAGTFAQLDAYLAQA